MSVSKITRNPIVVKMFLKKTTDVKLFMVKLKDHSQLKSPFADHECLYKVSWQSVQ